jgi:hypothetical protein
MDLFSDHEKQKEEKPVDQVQKLIGKVKCHLCKKYYVYCECWKTCECGWVHQNDKSCSNPIHK